MITLTEIKKSARTSRIEMIGYYSLRRGTAAQNNMLEIQYALVRDNVLGSAPSLWEKAGFSDVIEVNHSQQAVSIFEEIVSTKLTAYEIKARDNTKIAQSKADWQDFSNAERGGK